MRKYLTKKRVVVLAVAALGIGLGSGAYAYFTASGSGTGSASVGVASTIDLSGTSGDALYPDGPGVDVTITVTNPGSGSQYVNAVHLDSVDASNNACDTTAFSMPNVPVGQDLAAGGSTTVHGTLSMADNGQNQDACQGNSLTLHLSSN